METLPWVAVGVRWVHIGAACVALGGPVFMRLALVPAMAQVLDPPTLARLREAINRPWRIVVYVVITALILTGLYNFIFVANRWPLGDYKPLYHMMFGIKMVLAVGVFVLASALPGRTAAFAFLRANMRKSLLVLILLLLGIVLISNTLRAMRDVSGARASAPVLRTAVRTAE